MPFTFSHPAIILPLQWISKSWFSLTALVIGSLAPDFEYFIRMKIKSDYSHTIGGIFWFDLPLVILLSFIFHNIIKLTLFKNLPLFIRNKTTSFKAFNWNSYFKSKWHIVLLSAIIGIVSHIVWDSFTHHHGYFADTIPFLKNEVIIFNIEIPFWKIAQHGSSFVGALIILISFSKLPSDSSLQSNISKKYWIYISLSTLTICIFRFALNIKLLNLGNFIVTVIASFIISLILIPLLYNFSNVKS